jgi:glucose-6-phosphate 1-epimerase
LWTSAQAVYAAGKAIRGGVPICFPWFGAHGSQPGLPAHGFARTRAFRFEGSEERGDTVVAELTLESSPDTLAGFPHPFLARLRVTVDRELSLAFEVHNTGDEPFEYELALHSYFGVSDVRQVEVLGLEGASYDDKVSGARAAIESSSPLCFNGETDRVYASTSRVIVSDPGRKRRLLVHKGGSLTTVVWNPWVEKAKRMTDFGDDEWPHMLCVEAANTGAHQVQLPGGAQHITTTTISAESL